MFCDVLRPPISVGTMENAAQEQPQPQTPGAFFGRNPKMTGFPFRTAVSGVLHHEHTMSFCTFYTKQVSKQEVLMDRNDLKTSQHQLPLVLWGRAGGLDSRLARNRGRGETPPLHRSEIAGGPWGHWNQPGPQAATAGAWFATFWKKIKKQMAEKWLRWFSHWIATNCGESQWSIDVACIGSPPEQGTCLPISTRPNGWIWLSICSLFFSRLPWILWTYPKTIQGSPIVRIFNKPYNGLTFCR